MADLIPMFRIIIRDFRVKILLNCCLLLLLLLVQIFLCQALATVNYGSDEGMIIMTEGLLKSLLTMFQKFGSRHLSSDQ